jgi:hypothetical protein
MYQHRHQAHEKNRARREQDGSYAPDRFAVALLRLGVMAGKVASALGISMDKKSPFSAIGIRRA